MHTHKLIWSAENNITVNSGQAWAAATTEGLLIYSLDIGAVFEPFHLDTGITPEAIRNALRIKDYSKGMFNQRACMYTFLMWTPVFERFMDNAYSVLQKYV